MLQQVCNNPSGPLQLTDQSVKIGGKVFYDWNNKKNQYIITFLFKNPYKRVRHSEKKSTICFHTHLPK
jgi:hypothetical protein